MRGDACMGHLLKRIRGLEHPLQWMKRCEVPLSTVSSLLSSAELGLRRSSLGLGR